MNQENLLKALAAIKRAKTSLLLRELWLEELPQELAQATQLKKLDINHNSLSELPDWIGELSELQEINLWGNSLQTLPDTMSAMKGLKKIQLESNNIQTLPDSLAALTSLEELVLESNSLEVVPECISQMTNLKVLDLGRNPIKELPDWIGNLTNLTRLNLTYTAVTTLPPSIGKLKKLEHLYLYGVQMQKLPDAIGQLESLSNLAITDLEELQYFPDHLEGMKNLEDLSLNNCKLDHIPAGVLTLPKLKFLRMEENQLDHIPEDLLKIKSLNGIFFRENQIKEIPAYLSEQNWLTIDLACNDITLDSFPPNFASFKLQYLMVNYTPLAEVKLNADFALPEGVSIEGLKYKISKKSFLKDIREMAEAANDAALQEIEEKYLTKLNKSLKKWNGAEGVIESVTDFQKAFLKMLYDKKLAKIKKVAKTSIEIYYESSPRRVLIDIDKFTLPTADNSSWELTFNNKDFMGPVVVVTMNGWQVESEVLVG